MDSENERILREAGMAFFGTMTASLSHELNNVCAIINELSGLLGDHIAATERGSVLNPGKIKEVEEKIRKQVERGKVLVKRLNSFAHSSDEAVASISLRELLERIVAISRRFADMSRVRLEFEPPHTDVTLTTNPFMLQQAVFICIRKALEAADAKRLIKVYYETLEVGAAVSVESGDRAPRPEGESGEGLVLSLLMRELGGHVEYLSESDDSSRFKLFLPRVIQHAGG